MRSLLIASAVLLSSCTSNEATEELVGTYDVQLSLLANTCGSAIPATGHVKWEFREVAGEFTLLSGSGGQLSSSDGGRSFDATFPVDKMGCRGMTFYHAELTRDGDQFSATMKVTVSLTAVCAGLESCTYMYKALGQRS